MALFIKTDFVGGPCDGFSVQVPVSQLATGAVSCGNQTYVVQGVTPNLYRATWAQAVKNAGPGGPVVAPTQFDAAWTALMHTLAFTIPAQLTRQRVALQRIRRAVR